MKHYQFCAWVNVGTDPHILTLLRIILAQVGYKLKSLDKELPISSVEDKLLSNYNVIYLSFWLRCFLEQKRYLIVLDDLWSPDVWEPLISLAFPDSCNGSRILSTSRQKNFPLSVNTSLYTYELGPLNEEESWQLFLNKAFPQSMHQSHNDCSKELEDLGRELTKRCGGLPLALIVIGGLVSRKGKHPAPWIELLNNLNWVSTKDGQDCLDILALSYHDLPYQVKPCFLYLSAFRPDSEICTSKLTKVWAGDGLLPQKEGRTKVEICYEYLDELIQRCMVQVAIRGSDYHVKRIRIHGLLNELALTEAKDSGFLNVFRESLDKSLISGQQFHIRVAIHNELVEFPIRNPNDKLRALLAFPKSEACKKITIGGLVNKPCRYYHTWASKLYDLPLICSQPKITMCIRVLELEGVHAQEDRLEFPESNMIHLRYLGLRNTHLTEFPFSGCNLQCLQTLDIRGTMIKTLPSFIWTSKTLEHLYLNLMHPPSINGLKGLQTLSEVSCAEWIARGLSSLTGLQHLKMKLTETSCSDEVVNSLRVLSNIISLNLSGTKIPQETIKASSSHQRMFKLNLEGELQPNVLPAPAEFACYLTQLTLSRSSLEQDPMPTLKHLRSLRVLKLKNDAYVGKEIVCSFGGFSELQYLKFSNMRRLVYFQVELRALPSLTRLSIHKSLMNSYGDTVIGGLEQLTTLKILKLKDRPFLYTHPEITGFCQRNNTFLVDKKVPYSTAGVSSP